MDSVALLVLLALAMGILVRGVRRRSWIATILGLAVATTALIVFGFFSSWGQMLRFEEEGFLDRFWTVIGATVGIAALAALFSAALVALLTLPARHDAHRERRVGIAIAALAGAAWGAASFGIVLRWATGAASGRHAPLFGRGASDYLFSLPFFDAVFSLLFFLLVISTIVAWRSTPRRAPASRARRRRDRAHRRRARPIRDSC
ncbi:MAG: UPF0182 family protein [Labilithrix sp.]|nr:UPF0182 family protein [Labilithrix sp.]